MKKQKLIEKYFKKYSYDLHKIVGINPIDFSDCFLLEKGILTKISPKNIKNEHLLSSYIPVKNVITYELQIPKNIEEKISLDNYVETKCYEELGLDEAEEYIFKYKVIDNGLDEKNLLLEVVVVSKKEALEEYFNPFIKKTEHLDFINYFGWTFNVLYKTKILEPKKDLFIYMDKDEICMALYNESQFLQMSVIPGGLESLYSSLEESINIKNFTFDKFLSVILKKGLELDNYQEREQILFNELSELFSNKFLIISNQLNSMIRKFSLGTIDRIFITTMKGIIPGINEFANMYLGVDANDLKFDTKYNPTNIQIDQVLFLNMLYANYAYSKNEQEDNFTIFKRYPTFFYRKSGQFISIAAVSLIISLLYPSLQAIHTLFVDKKNQDKKIELMHLDHKHQQLLNNYKKLAKEKKFYQTKKKNIAFYNKKIETIISTIYIDKKGYVPKAELLANLNKYLYQNKVYLDNVNYLNKILTLSVSAKNEKYITDFIDNIVQKEHIIVSTPGFTREKNYYSAKINIKVGL